MSDNEKCEDENKDLKKVEVIISVKGQKCDDDENKNLKKREVIIKHTNRKSFNFHAGPPKIAEGCLAESTHAFQGQPDEVSPDEAPFEDASDCETPSNGLQQEPSFEAVCECCETPPQGEQPLDEYIRQEVRKYDNPCPPPREAPFEDASECETPPREETSDCKTPSRSSVLPQEPSFEEASDCKTLSRSSTLPQEPSFKETSDCKSPSRSSLLPQEPSLERDSLPPCPWLTESSSTASVTSAVSMPNSAGVIDSGGAHHWDATSADKEDSNHSMVRVPNAGPGEYTDQQGANKDSIEKVKKAVSVRPTLNKPGSKDPLGITGDKSRQHSVHWTDPSAAEVQTPTSSESDTATVGRQDSCSTGPPSSSSMPPSRPPLAPETVSKKHDLPAGRSYLCKGPHSSSSMRPCPQEAASKVHCQTKAGDQAKAGRSYLCKRPPSPSPMPSCPQETTSKLPQETASKKPDEDDCQKDGCQIA